jgi:hypothetical protein
MAVRVFRCIVRGRFAALDHDTRAGLLAEADAHDLLNVAGFTAEGTLTYDRRIDFFSYRFEVRLDSDDVDGGDAELSAHAEAVAVARADAALARAGLPHRGLKATSTDMASMWR